MKLVETKRERRNITVELTPQDQDVIYSMCMVTGGGPSGPRGVSDIIKELLQSEYAQNLPRNPSNRNFFWDNW